MADTDIVEAGFKPREKRYELKTVEGGWVRLRRMDHGHSNALTDIRLSFKQDEDKTGKAVISTKSGRHFQFEHAIVDHNLGANGKKFNFREPKDVDSLDPDVGDEIADLIDNHQSLIKDDELPNSEAS